MITPPINSNTATLPIRIARRCPRFLNRVVILFAALDARKHYTIRLVGILFDSSASSASCAVKLRNWPRKTAEDVEALSFFGNTRMHNLP